MSLFGHDCNQDGHRYEARYDSGVPTLKNVRGAYEADQITQIIEASRVKTYVYDICTRCGHILKRV